MLPENGPVSHESLASQRLDWTFNSLKFRIGAVIEDREARQANLAMLFEFHGSILSASATGDNGQQCDCKGVCRA